MVALPAVTNTPIPESLMLRSSISRVPVEEIAILVLEIFESVIFRVPVLIIPPDSRPSPLNLVRFAVPSRSIPIKQ